MPAPCAARRSPRLEGVDVTIASSRMPLQMYHHPIRNEVSSNVREASAVEVTDGRSASWQGADFCCFGCGSIAIMSRDLDLKAWDIYSVHLTRSARA